MWLRPYVPACFFDSGHRDSRDTRPLQCGHAKPSVHAMTLRPCDNQAHKHPYTCKLTILVYLSSLWQHKCPFACIKSVFAGLSWERLFVHAPAEEWAGVRRAGRRSKVLLPGHVILCQKLAERERSPACISPFSFLLVSHFFLGGCFHMRWTA